MILSPNQRWVFFDLDGTLVNSLGALREVYFSFLRHFGIKGTNVEFEAINGPTINEIAGFLKRRYKLRASEEVLARLYRSKVVDLYLRRVRLVGGAKAVLKKLRQNGYKMALVTSSYSQWVKPFLIKNNIDSFFSVLALGDEVQNSKPHPDIYRLALDRSKSRPQDAVVVEDSNNGEKSALLAGLKVIRVQKKLNGLTEQIQRYFDKRSNQLLITSEQKLSVVTRRRPRKKPNQIFVIESVKSEAKQIKITGIFISYRTWKKLGAKSVALAVSGLVIGSASHQKRVLIGKRSGQVSSYQHRWELVPSGGVDASACARSNQVNLKQMILRELQEEAAVAPAAVQEIVPRVLIADVAQRVWDVGFRVKLKSGALPVIKPNLKEYTQMKWISTAETERLFGRVSSSVVPASCDLWNASKQDVKGEI